MAILNLRYGYFARLGQDSVIDDEASPRNETKTAALKDFNRLFNTKRKSFAGFMPPNTIDVDNKFDIISDNPRESNRSIDNICEQNGLSYSLVVYSVEQDIINKFVKEDLENRKQTLRNLYDLSKRFNRQIFEVDSNKYPLFGKNVKKFTGLDLGYYLMDNAIESRRIFNARCEKWGIVDKSENE